MIYDMLRRAKSELIGTFWLVFGGYGSAVLATAFTNLGISFTGVALAFGLTVLSMAYAVGHISGVNFNPAVTFGLWEAGRCPNRHVGPYLTAQVLGALLGSTVLYYIASGKPDWTIGIFATNGYVELIQGNFNRVSCFVAEIIITSMFAFIIIVTPSKVCHLVLAVFAIGFTLVLIHLISIPITNTSVNLARSKGVALFTNNGYIGQLWTFWVAPLLGAIITGFISRIFYESADPAEIIIVYRQNFKQW